MKSKRTKTPLTRTELEHFVLNHIATWVEEEAEQFNYEEKNFYDLPQLYRNEMDTFTNLFRSRWFDYEKENNLRSRGTVIT
jgi:hypothetical protein